jgi:hypothetical protein
MMHDDAVEEEAQNFFRLSVWLQRMAEMADRWSPPSVHLVLSMLAKHGLTYDESGHDFTWHVLAARNLDRVRWWIDTNCTTDLLCPSTAPRGRNILQAAERLYAQALQSVGHPKPAVLAGSLAVLQLVRESCSVWFAVHWPRIRVQVELHLIPDIVSIVLAYLTPPPGLAATDPVDSDEEVEESDMLGIVP